MAKIQQHKETVKKPVKRATSRPEKSVVRFDEGAQILVIGAGAIGGISAAFMKLAGYDIEIVCNHEDYRQKIEKGGLHIFGVRKDHKVVMKAYAKLTQVKKQYDVVFVATKVTALAEIKSSLKKILKSGTLVVSLQNGVVIEELAKMVGKERAISAVVGWGATMHSHGELEMTSTGEFIIGSLPKVYPDGIEFVQKVLNTVLPTDISTNIIGALYSKLIINSCITAIGAVSGLFLGEMLSKKNLRNVFIAIMYEAMATAKAAGIHVEKYGNKIDYYQLLDGTGWWSNFKRHALIRLIGFKYRRLKSSSLQSLERKKKTEIDELNGYITKLGRKHKVATPINDAIVQMVKEIEAGKREITPKNLEHPALKKVWEK